MSTARAIIAALVGVNVFQVMTGGQTYSVLKTAEDEGVRFTFNLPLVGRQVLTIRPPSSSGDSGPSTATVELGPKAQAKKAAIVRNAALASVAAGLAAFALSGVGERKRIERAVDRRLGAHDDELEPL